MRFTRYNVCDGMRALLVCSALSLLILNLASCKAPPHSIVDSQIATPSVERERELSPLVPPTIVPIPSMAAMTGQIVSSSTRPMANTTVRLARVFWNEQHTDGAYVLEGANSPSTITNDDGFFVFASLSPADYVLIVGDVFGDHVVVSKPDGSARVFTVKENEVTDVGRIFVDLPTINQ